MTRFLHRTVFAVGLIILAGSIGRTASAVSWQASQDLPAGPGKDTTLRLCQSCHEIERVVANRHSNKEWIELIEKMVSQGADGKDEEFDQVIAYLTDHYGKPVEINTATVAQIVDGLGLIEDQAKAIVAFRAGHPAFATWKDVAAVPGVDAALIERRQKNFRF